jgi:hypothetical protein
VRYDQASNTTRAIFVRYYVMPYGGGTVKLGLQARPYEGNVSLASLLQDGRERADANIQVVSNLEQIK